MPDYKVVSDSLNPSQRQAVMHGEGPLLVLAGPGSGKTTVIVNRIRYLIFNRQVPPEEILVITFTKDAAVSMQQRFQQKSELVSPVSFGTFHSIFYHILLQSPQSSFSFSDSPKILTQAQKRNLVQSVLKKMRADSAAGTEGYLHPAHLEADAALILAAIGYYKNTEDEAGAVRHLSAEYRAQFREILAAYQRILRQDNAMDFEDMVFECRLLLEQNEECRKYWQNRFSHILVDEFQDINPLQYQVIKLLAKPPYNLFAVGDDDQAIYGFRGAEPACLKRYAEEFDAKRIVLDRNYRSGRTIVEASLKVIGENRERYAKKLFAASGAGALQIRSFEEREQELAYLQEQITDFQQKHPGESCAVLFRTNLFLRSFGRMLDRRGIPCVMKEKAGNFYEHFAVKDVTAYLKFAAGDRRRGIFLQFMNKPSRYLRRDALGDMEIIDFSRMRAWYADCGGLRRTECLLAIDRLESQIHALEKMPPALAVRYVCKAMGYENYLREQAAARGQDALQEWMEILDWLKLDAAGCRTVKEWIAMQGDSSAKEWIAMQGDSPAKAPAGKEEKENAVQLMTIHAAKGLEFDKVWIPDCNEKNFPHGSLPDRRTAEEERRIFYVGMTRAKKSLELLYLTGTKERPRLMSRFLNPIADAYSSSNSSNSQLSRYSSKASATFSYSSSSSM